MRPRAPEPLNAEHEVGRFDCGVASLNNWLRTRAYGNQIGGGSRTYVVVGTEGVVAYYALAAGSISGREVTGRFRRNMPEPVPVIVLGRLAVDRGWSGKGLGRALVADAIRRTLTASETVGVRGMLIHALDEAAADFYLRLGFQPSAVRPLTLMSSVDDLRASL